MCPSVVSIQAIFIWIAETRKMPPFQEAFKMYIGGLGSRWLMVISSNMAKFVTNVC